MSKKSAKKRQPVKPVVAKEPARTAKNFGYEEMLSELEAIVADAETTGAGCGVNALSGLQNPTTSTNCAIRRPDKTRQHRIRHDTQNWRLSGLARHNLDNLPIRLLHRMAC